MPDITALHPEVVRAVRVPATVTGSAGLFALYEAADHGETVVYVYAGGVGIRSKDSADVRRLLVPGLYHSAIIERDARRPGSSPRGG